MKLKKRMFPFMLAFAILLTAIGFVSANISFSKPTATSLTFDVNINNVNSNNIDVVGYDKTNVTYTLNLDEFINDYTISFDVYNESDFDIYLSRVEGIEVPYEYKDIITVEKTFNNTISKNQYDSVYIKYSLKNNLTKEQKGLLKDKDLKINILLNYDQA